jgi:hypothetical protein
MKKDKAFENQINQDVDQAKKDLTMLERITSAD